MLPLPCEVVWGQPRELTRQANVVAGRCSVRLRRAVTRLAPMGLTVSFDIEEQPRPIPRLSDSYAYRISVGDHVRIAAATEWGALAGLATLAQLGADGELEVARVRDEPRFPWRGIMLDTARHFITLATLKRTLDAMWFYKLNVLHLHLTDDQAFRFRAATFPELASPLAYSAAELADLVAYAADRGVRVVPELDMPGHSTSWLAVHPEWGLDPADAPAGPSERFGVHPACLDPGNPVLVQSVETLLAELAAVFPDECIHFGGDEVAGLDRRRQYQFHRHVVEYLAGLGKRAVGWDECLSATLPVSTVVQSWRGARGRDTSPWGPATTAWSHRPTTWIFSTRHKRTTKRILPATWWPPKRLSDATRASRMSSKAWLGWRTSRCSRNLRRPRRDAYSAAKLAFGAS